MQGGRPDQCGPGPAQQVHLFTVPAPLIRLAPGVGLASTQLSLPRGAAVLLLHKPCAYRLSHHMLRPSQRQACTSSGRVFKADPDRSLAVLACTITARRMLTSRPCAPVVSSSSAAARHPFCCSVAEACDQPGGRNGPRQAGSCCGGPGRPLPGPGPGNLSGRRI